jgi:hypothetical protein
MSLITDPADGRIPPLAHKAQTRTDGEAAASSRPIRVRTCGEDRSFSESCSTFGASRLGASYNSYYRIVESATLW